MIVNLSTSHSGISDSVLNEALAKARETDKMLREGTGKGNDFLGWVGLPSTISASEISTIKDESERLRSISDYIVVIGIGGSYLGARAVIEALQNPYDCKTPVVLFAGYNLSEAYHFDMLEFLKDKKFSVIVISKSGTTTEPAIAFRLFKQQLNEKYGDKHKERITAITDSKKGALKELADKEGYKTFVIPDNVGGRYSVLTHVGLLPITCAGYDISRLIDGAKQMQKELELNDNPALTYAAVRNVLHKKGKDIEMLVSYEPGLQYIQEWWKQLYGESEGKDGKGIFPASAVFTTDLHSLGQLIQEGKRNLFETVLKVKTSQRELTINHEESDSDGLNYLAGKRISYVNQKAMEGTLEAHIQGGVPNIIIEIDTLDEYNIGGLLYFFMRACGISGYMLGVNPFDQPGVEQYKKNMFKLLGKK